MKMNDYRDTEAYRVFNTIDNTNKNKINKERQQDGKPAVFDSRTYGKKVQDKINFSSTPQIIRLEPSSKPKLYGFVPQFSNLARIDGDYEFYQNQNTVFPRIASPILTVQSSKKPRSKKARKNIDLTTEDQSKYMEWMRELSNYQKMKETQESLKANNIQKEYKSRILEMLNEKEQLIETLDQKLNQLKDSDSQISPGQEKLYSKLNELEAKVDGQLRNKKVLTSGSEDSNKLNYMFDMMMYNMSSLQQMVYNVAQMQKEQVRLVQKQNRIIEAVGIGGIYAEQGSHLIQGLRGSKNSKTLKQSSTVKSETNRRRTEEERNKQINGVNEDESFEDSDPISSLPSISRNGGELKKSIIKNLNSKESNLHSGELKQLSIKSSSIKTSSPLTISKLSSKQIKMSNKYNSKNSNSLPDHNESDPPNELREALQPSKTSQESNIRNLQNNSQKSNNKIDSIVNPPPSTPNILPKAQDEYTSVDEFSNSSSMRSNINVNQVNLMTASDRSSHIKNSKK